MTVPLERLDPNLPDPVESRRRVAGRMVRIAYATIVFGLLGFVVIYFGAPLVFLSGPGTVSSPRYAVSLPYTVQVVRMGVVSGAHVSAGEEIGQVVSPEHDSIVATYMLALSDIIGQSAELRIKARVASQSLEAARTYKSISAEADKRMAATTAAEVIHRMEVLRELALATKQVVTLEAEVSESAIQLSVLDQFNEQLRLRLGEVERRFDKGRVTSPISGIVSTGHAYGGQSLVAGAPIAEILDPDQIFVEWYLPNIRLIDPKIGYQVVVLFGSRRIAGSIAEILPVSEVYAKAQSPQVGVRPASQIARIRLARNTTPPPLNASVTVRMHYFELTAWFVSEVASVLGLD